MSDASALREALRWAGEPASPAARGRRLVAVLHELGEYGSGTAGDIARAKRMSRATLCEHLGYIRAAIGFKLHSKKNYTPNRREAFCDASLRHSGAGKIDNADHW